MPEGLDIIIVDDDPDFRNAGTDFKLKASSPCKNTGYNTGAATDLTGRTTPSGSAHDIGCYEWFLLGGMGHMRMGMSPN